MYYKYLILISSNKSKYLKNFISSINKSVIKKNNVKIIFIENNLYPINKKIILKTFNKYKLDFTYFLEKKIGIPYARNRAIREAKKIQSKYVLFFDDDCEIDNKWFVNFEKIEEKNKNQFDVLTGPQISKNKKFSSILRRSLKDLSVSKWAATNNVIFKKAILNKINFNFDLRLRNSGGSDQLFFMKIYRLGYKILWSDKIIVRENILYSRNSLDWLFKRGLRYGLSSWFIYSNVYGKFYGFIFILSKFFYEMLFLINCCLELFFNSRANSFKVYFHFYKMIGTIKGLFSKKNIKYY